MAISTTLSLRRVSFAIAKAYLQYRGNFYPNVIAVERSVTWQSLSAWNLLCAKGGVLPNGKTEGLHYPFHRNGA